MISVTNLSILFAIGAMICWGIGDFVLQKSARKAGNVHTLMWIGILGSIGLLPFVWNDLSLLLIPKYTIMLLSLGILCLVASLLDLEALKKGKLSVVEITYQSELLITVGLALFFLKETLEIYQIVLIVLVFLGIVFSSTKSLSLSTKKIEKGVFLAFISAMLFGTINFLTGVSSKALTPQLAIWSQWIMFTIFCIFLVIYREGFGSIKKVFVENKSLLIITGIIDTLAWVFYALSTKTNSISITTAITEGYPAIGLMLGVFINKEKILIHQWIGAIIALSCSTILALTSM